MALIPGTGRYRSKTFKDVAKARAWARGEAAAAEVGAPTAALTLGKVMLADLRVDYEKGLVARGRSDSHLANVRRTLDEVSQVAPNLADPSAKLSIGRWLDGLTCSANSRNRKMVEVRAICRWALRHDLLDKDPTRALERADVPDKLKAQFTVAELVHLLALPTPDPAWRIRFAVMLYAGLRDDEAAAITLADLDLSGRTGHVRKHVGHRLKRGKERTIDLQGELLQILCDRGPGKVAPVPDKNARRGFSKFLKACGVARGERTPHSCRHTYAALMTATGVAGFLLADLMGHSSQATTAEYARLARQHSRAVDGWKRGEFRLLAAL